MTDYSITANAVPHRDARMNRVILEGNFKAMRALGVTQRMHIDIMKHAKNSIRRRDAEQTAWFTGPTRMMWMQARQARGEFKSWTDEQLGRELRPAYLEDETLEKEAA